VLHPYARYARLSQQHGEYELYPLRMITSPRRRLISGVATSGTAVAKGCPSRTRTEVGAAAASRQMQAILNALAPVSACVSRVPLRAITTTISRASSGQHRRWRPPLVPAVRQHASPPATPPCGLFEELRPPSQAGPNRHNDDTSRTAGKAHVSALKGFPQGLVGILVPGHGQRMDLADPGTAAPGPQTVKGG
jgi:hypothetical protein